MRNTRPSITPNGYLDPLSSAENLQGLQFVTTLKIALTFAISIVGVLLATASPARADLRVCNQTSNPVSVALGYKSERGWQSEGWWIASPDDCTIVFQGDLESRYYYLFAADDLSGGSWDGKIFMCSQSKSFTISGVEDCLARGYERTGFFEVDTGDNSNWTLQLTDAEQTEPNSQ